MTREHFVVLLPGFIGTYIYLIAAFFGSSGKIAARENEIRELKTKVSQHHEEIQKLRKNIETRKREFDVHLKEDHWRTEQVSQLLLEQNRHFPWLATAFADLQDYIGKRDEESKRCLRPIESPLAVLGPVALAADVR